MEVSQLYLHKEITEPAKVSLRHESDHITLAEFCDRTRKWTAKVSTVSDGCAASRDAIMLSPPTCKQALRLAELTYITLMWYFQHSNLRGKITAKPGAPVELWAVQLCFEETTVSGSYLRYLLEAGIVEEDTGPATKQQQPSGRDFTSLVVYNHVFSQLNPAHFYADVSSPLPPKPLRYVISGGVRHPVRSIAPLLSEWLYYRHVKQGHINSIFRLRRCTSADDELLHKWMNDPRVSKFWGEDGPIEQQRNFINKNLESKHSFPTIGTWQDINPDGTLAEIKDACYFEIYWAKEDHIAHYSDSVGLWDRGIHVLVGEEWARGRVSAWLNSLVHYLFIDDPRTQCIFLEPRVDNTRFINLLQDNDFYKEKEFSFPHKQAALMQLKREAWKGL